MRIESFIGLRFLGAKRQARAISLITWFSMVGVMLGVTALIVTISVMNGFRENLFVAVTGTTPHVRILPEGAGPMAAATRAELEQRLAGWPEVAATAPYISRQAFVAVGKEFRAVILRGVEPAREQTVTEVARFLEGDPAPPTEEPDGIPGAMGGRAQRVFNAVAFPPPAGTRAGVVLGLPLTSSLGLLTGDKVRLVSPVQRMTPIGPVPLMKELRLVGYLNTGLSGQDDTLAYLDYRLAQRLFRLGDATDGLAVRVRDPQAIDADAWRARLPGFRLVVWSEENRNIFQVMRLEKLGLFLILTLIILVSFFNIISSLVMLVLEKRKGIAILKTMGAPDGMVRRIFLTQGLWIGAIGTVGGLVLGLGMCWALSTFDLIRFPEGVFPLSSRLPVLVDWTDVALITGASFLICVLVTLYPATRAARVHPVENLRYE